MTGIIASLHGTYFRWVTDHGLLVVTGLFCACIAVLLRDVGPRTRSLLRKCALLLVSGFVGVTVIEIGLRVIDHLSHETLEDAGNRQAPSIDDPDREVTLGEIIRPSSDADIIYELIPTSRYRFKGHAVEINTAGFRGPSLPRVPPTGTVRIVGIGDSSMFGWGVAQDETYLARMEQALAELHPGTRWQTVNTAVPGYNTAMEVATLRVKGLAFQPDVVVVGFSGNDLDLPNFLYRSENYFRLDKSFLRMTLDRVLGSTAPRTGLMPAPFDHQAKRYLREPERVPEAYRHMVGEAGVLNAMQELASLARIHEFQVLVLGTRHLHPLAKRACALHAFEVVEGIGTWRRHVEARGLTDERAAWQLNAADPHPNSAAHSVVATAIVEYGERRGLFSSLKKRK